MKRRSLFAFAAASALVVVVVACSDSSTSLHAASYAQHFDSLYSVEVASHSGIETGRAQVLSDIEIATAFGAVPVAFPMKTSTGVETVARRRVYSRSESARSVCSIMYSSCIGGPIRIRSSRSISIRPVPQKSPNCYSTIARRQRLYDVTGNSVLTSQHAGCSSPPDAFESHRLRHMPSRNARRHGSRSPLQSISTSRPYSTPV